MTTTGKRKWVAAVTGAFLLLLLAGIWIMRLPAPVSVTFDHYERSGLSNYAVIAITNHSTTPMNFTSFNTSPEGTVKHVYSLLSTNGRTDPEDFKPQQQGTLYHFSETLEKREGRSVRVPVDDIERRVGISFFVAAQNATPAHELHLRLRLAIRRLIGLSNDVGNLVWCPVSLKL